MKTTVYVACHKPVSLDLPAGYKIIQVNAKKNGHMDFADCWDDEGDNISSKNPNYCELTALYWMWKHDQSDVTGLVHYRRFFYTAGSWNPFRDRYVVSPETDISSYIRLDRVGQLLEEADIILPEREYYDDTLKGQYIRHHRKSDFDALEQVVKELYPAYGPSFDAVMNGCMAYRCNMFITRRELFADYMKWLTDVLFALEQKITISKDPYQSRVFGFLSERLLTLYVYHNHLRVRRLPLLFLEDGKKPRWVKRRNKAIWADLGIRSWYPGK